MLKPNELMEYEFKNSGRNAYKADDVDQFISQVAYDYEKLFRENVELARRMSLLADKLDQIKNSGELENAKKQADSIVEEAKTRGESDYNRLLDMAKQKAREIIDDAKSQADEIILNAKSSASDKVGAATRTVASETIYFDMLKKEVSEFKANVLSQYKQHIELISKLPEIAVQKAAEEAAADVSVKEADAAAEVSEETTDGFVEEAVDEIASEAIEEASADEYIAEADDAAEDTSDEYFEVSEDSEADVVLSDEDSSGIVFDDVKEDDLSFKFEEPEEASAEFEDDSFGEPVIKTELPYDFFGENDDLEFVENKPEEKLSVEIPDDADGFESFLEDGENVVPAETEVKKGFSIDLDGIKSVSDDVYSDSYSEPEAGFEEFSENDIPISKGFSINKNAVSHITDTDSLKETSGDKGYDLSYWDEDDEDVDERSENKTDGKKHKRGFFRK